ncbi:exodeoxyribonuclease V subunit beta [Nocardioides mangrovicus]|uniref:RecBCD enzyme subunit RecB n=1 Tax=Nocardioides mangrovicus TaxID=2478913 RepID=A0A3L8NZL3_9ACTN|nr:UvrD-helicase domain-containing protein [Nocardioides mangrovicus]RLV47993.1 exodeoxyribonuclease V subunit beta [Nocardioides mangrovicus]
MTSPTRPEGFDLLGPLPTGTTVLEASAGTGKTFAIGALVTRYVAEGVADLSDLLVVTFGRAATRELRSRVRHQLGLAERALALRLAGEPVGPTDEVVTLLLQGTEQQLADRRRRLVRALSGYDAATIATIHEFCQLVLRSLGVAGDVDPGAHLVENLDDLVREVVDDVYLARFGPRAEPPFTHAVAMTLGQEAVGDPQARLMPDDAPDDSPTGERYRFAAEVREEVARRKRERGILGFDDLLGRLAASLAAEGSRAAERMRERWRIVLVDEFQDTDPVQWEVFERAFHGHATMVLVGDPKQAIYAFRGGDVPSYLAAREVAGTIRSLEVNWRSDAALVDALGVLLDDVELGDERIRVQPVRAHHAERRLAGAEDPTPVRVRVVHGAELGTTKQGYVAIDKLRRRIAADMAGDIAALLASGATLAGRRVEPRDIAILLPVRTGLELFRAELTRHGVPSVVTAGSDVLAGTAGREWLVLLEALDQPQSTRRVRSLALTSLMGVTAERLEAGGDALTDDLAERVRRWLDLFRSRGVAAVFEAIRAGGLAERVLALEDGRRHLTDLAHIAETLHDVARRRRLGTSALLEWLHEERESGDVAERSRRLDTDEDAVQILTVHGSKGLQFGFVYLPMSFHDRELPNRQVHLYHHDGRRCLDVSGEPSASVRKAAVNEDLAEELRLTYVALTRAEVQVTLWSAQSKDSDGAGVSRLLLGRDPGQATVANLVPIGIPDADVDARLARWQAAGAIGVAPAEPVEQQAPAVAEGPLAPAARRFDRGIDTDWRRTSYSGLIRAEERTATSAADSEPEEAGTVDEADDVEGEGLDDAGLPSAAAGTDGPVSPMEGLPSGATFGSLVHGVLEHADPAAPDLAAELRRCVVEQLRWWPVEAGIDELVEGLLPMQHTPLGPLAADLTLAQIGLGDRLSELDFEFPLAGGDTATRKAPLLRTVGEVMLRHLPADDLLRDYATRLAVPSLGDQPLRGYLSGSIDVVLRVPGGDGEPRFVVVDYKTNRLGGPDRVLTAWDYTPPAMAESMLHSHYPLQALLYSVVLHRFLRWRLPGYAPERHLGGVLYLYVRGMCGPDTPVVGGQPCGVLAWTPPAATIVELSDLMAAQESAR